VNQLAAEQRGKRRMHAVPPGCSTHFARSLTVPAVSEQLAAVHTDTALFHARDKMPILALSTFTIGCKYTRTRAKSNNPEISKNYSQQRGISRNHREQREENGIDGCPWEGILIPLPGAHGTEGRIRFDEANGSVYVGEKNRVVVLDCMQGGAVMDNLRKLLEAFSGCGEAAAIYKGQSFNHVNDLFARIFEREPAEFEGLPLLDLCHDESIEMIRDFMHRRTIEDHGVPINYSSMFITSKREKIELNVIALKLKQADDNVLLIVRKA
jgi:PAS domain-containing protein